MVEKKENDEELENGERHITDWDLPLSFTKSRHTEIIEGVNAISQTWRMKERVSLDRRWDKNFSFRHMSKTWITSIFPDENCQCCSSFVPKRRSGSSGYCKDSTVCTIGMLDRYVVIVSSLVVLNFCFAADPLSLSPSKALETIGSALQKQYERWQPRARYKQSLDPTVEEVKKLCTSLRRNAKEERVLFHYNGHGVPKPTENGEIWVFNRVRWKKCVFFLFYEFSFQTYTQYIPLSVYDLQTWMGAPSIYVYDCSCAGTIVKSFKSFAEQHKNEFEAVR